MIRIRTVTEQDAVELQRIAEQTFRETFAESNSLEDMQHYLTSRLCLSQLRREINHPNMFFYFAEIDQHIVGYLKLNVAGAQTEPQSQVAKCG